MALTYGVCQDFKGVRLNVGRTMLSCATNVLFYPTGLSGEATTFRAAVVDPSSFLPLCVAAEYFARGITGTYRLNTQPLMVGCCAEAGTTPQTHLIDTAIGGVKVSGEYGISINGNGDPLELAATLDGVAVVIANAVDVGSSDVAIGGPDFSAQSYIPSGYNTDQAMTGWSTGSANFSSFEGIGEKMDGAGTNALIQDDPNWNINIDINTGMVEAQLSYPGFESRSSSVPCTTTDLSTQITAFITLLKAA